MFLSFFSSPFPFLHSQDPTIHPHPKPLWGGGWGWGCSHNMFSSSSFSHIHTTTVSTRWLLATSLKYLKFTNPLHSFEIFLYSPLYSHPVQFRGHPNPRTTVPLYTCALAMSLKYLKFTNQPTSYALFCLFLYSVQSSCAAGGTSKSKNQLSLCTHALTWSDIFFLCSTICLKHYFAKSRQRYPNTLSSSRSSLKTSLF